MDKSFTGWIQKIQKAELTRTCRLYLRRLAAWGCPYSAAQKCQSSETKSNHRQ